MLFIVYLCCSTPSRERDVIFTSLLLDFPGDSVVKNLPANVGDAGDTEDLGSVSGSGRSPEEEEEMTIHSSILAWEIPWTEKPDGLQSMSLQRVGQSLVTEHAHSLLSLE